MPTTNASTVVDFDADGALAAVQARVSGTLRSFAEFDGETFNTLFVDDDTVALYENEAHMRAHFSKLHSYLYLDLAETELFTEQLFPNAEEVSYLVTALDYVKLVRLYQGDAGLFLALDPDEPVQPLVEAIREAIGHEE